jgi:type IV pilus assembly protein PilE
MLFCLGRSWDTSSTDATLERVSNLTENEYYELSVNGNATSYTLRATAHGSQLDDTDCKTLTMNNVGIKIATSASGDNLTETCW